LISSVDRTGCGGPVILEITSLDFGTITYKCGDVIKSQIFFLAWSTAE
jgi:hypothetical protein